MSFRRLKRLLRRQRSVFWLRTVLPRSATSVAGADTLSPRVASLFADPDGRTAGRMSIATALCAGLLALSIAYRRERPTLSDAFSSATALVSGTALLGYLYDAADLYQLPMFNTMALNTAIGFFCLAFAAMACFPSSGVAQVLATRVATQRTVSRRLLAFLCVLPLVGWALVRATQSGRRALALPWRCWSSSRLRHWPG